jgi:hypothetical protein
VQAGILQNLYQAVILVFLMVGYLRGVTSKRACKIEYHTVQGIRCKAFSAYLPALSAGGKERLAATDT